MILPRAAFVSGAIFCAAIFLSVGRRSQFRTWSAWWDSEGCCIWMIAVMVGGGLLIPR